MIEWEYAVESWIFVGPHRDDWPHADRWRQLLREQEQAAGPGVITMFVRLEGPEADHLSGLYYQWQRQTEKDWLDEMGSVGFELVSIYRDEDRGEFGRPFPLVDVTAYFKRPRLKEMAPKPIIGFGRREGDE